MFFTSFLDIGTLGESNIEETSTAAYQALTSGDDVPLDFHVYKLSFLNFLLGKQPNGPGQFIFGTVEPSETQGPFNIDYTALTVSDSEDPEMAFKETLTEQMLEEMKPGLRRSIVV